MSNLLEQASLVMIPSGYKEDVVYSEIPINGAGDLAFTRASNGTRINSQGLVEVVPWNLFQQSENFPNAIWTKSTLTFNSTVTAPNGTSTAQNYSTAGAYSYVLQTITVSSGEYYTVSCYLKYTSGVGSISIGYTDAPSNNFIRVDANLINGTIGSVSYGGNGANGTATITSVGDGWYRVTVSGTLTIGNAGLIVSNLALGATTFNIWGAQLNIGATAKPYFPTTDRLNVPRLTYQNGGGGCPSLLLEKQSTNLLSYSEQFDNAGWTVIGTSITSNNTTSPDGTQNADKISEDSSNGLHLVYNTNILSTGAGTWTTSIFYKKGTRRYFAIKMQIGSSSYTQVFDADGLTTGGSSSNGLTSVSSTIVSMGNGWVRATLTGTDASGGGSGLGIFSLSNSATPTFDAGNFNPTYQGSTSEYGFFYGAQLEASSYPTSYIPTTSSSATRVADACSKTGISSLIGQTEGTLFFEGSQIGAATTVPFQLSDTTNANRVQIEIGSSGQPLLVASSAGTTQAVIVGSSYTIGQNRKIAVTYKNNDFRLYQNGVLIGSDTSGSVPLSLTAIYLGSEAGTPYLDVQIKQIVNFKTSLTNAECIALTTI